MRSPVEIPLSARCLSLRMGREPEGAKREGDISLDEPVGQREIQKATEGQPPRNTTRILPQIMAEINAI